MLTDVRHSLGSNPTLSVFFPFFSFFLSTLIPTLRMELSTQHHTSEEELGGITQILNLSRAGHERERRQPLLCAWLAVLHLERISPSSNSPTMARACVWCRLLNRIDPTAG
jgi:hypothetical protein